MKINYEKLGLRCGLEIHQQLDTHKLFCNCPSLLRDDTPDIIVRRKLRAVPGELGEIDIAALHEMLKEKQFIYEAYSTTTCLIELDEAPPLPINKDAVNVAVQVSAMLHAKPVDEIQVMRKTVIDGSNTTGFQRTALVARNGFLETNGGKVAIPTICLEEESARQISSDDNSITFRLDRLGIPLVEITTAPELKSPEEVREAAEKIGMILRSTGMAKRGIGTIRQDINVSIKDGNRVEIKGAQELKLLPKLVEYEIVRQINLIEVKKDLERRKVRKQRINIRNVSKIFANTRSNIIAEALRNNGVVLAIKVHGFSGLLNKELQPNRRIGTELAERAKVAGQVGGIIHSDEKLAKYGISDEEILALKKYLAIKKDAFIIIADKEEKARKGMKAVIERIYRYFEGVPREVRKVNEDGTTSYLRPIPGASRMYPETDVVPITPEISAIKIPELISEKAERVKEYGLGKELADMLAKSGKTDVFERFVAQFKNLNPAFIAENYLTAEKVLKRKYGIETGLPDDVFGQVFDAINSGKIAKETFLDVLVNYSKSKKVELEKFKKLSDSELEKEVRRIVRENKRHPLNVVIGRAIAQLRGKAEVGKIIELVKKLR